MLADDLDVVIGVDTHKHTHTAAAVSATGSVLEQLTVAANPRGYRQLIVFGQRHEAQVWAIEGTGSFGAGLTAALLAQGVRVVEVDRPQRPARRAGAKSDEIDAVRAARQALAGVGVSEPRGRGEREAIRVLLATRAQAVEFRTRAISALHALVTSAPDSLRERLRSLTLGELLHACAALRGSSRQSAEEFATVMALRSTARRALACAREAMDLETQIDMLVRRIAPDLLDQVGIGPVVAAQVIASWSHRGRVHSEAAFAKLGGVAPIEASSGMVIRHRLNRSGDRQLNRALHTIVLVRMRQDENTKTYVKRRLAEGKSLREIRRCLKRYVARQLFRQLEAMPSMP
ncbi:MAG: IS110 family transposase [Nitriliruptorales bacterium]